MLYFKCLAINDVADVEDSRTSHTDHHYPGKGGTAGASSCLRHELFFMSPGFGLQQPAKPMAANTSQMTYDGNHAPHHASEKYFADGFCHASKAARFNAIVTASPINPMVLNDLRFADCAAPAGASFLSMTWNRSQRHRRQNPMVHAVPAAARRMPYLPNGSVNPHLRQRICQPGALDSQCCSSSGVGSRGAFSEFITVC